MDSLNLVLKFTERCNLNCSYCYYFNGLDRSFRDRPALLSEDVVDKIITFLNNGIVDLGIKHLGISIHGGEPLLMPKNQFRSLSDKLSSAFSSKLDTFALNIQTNGVLIDKEWIRIFDDFKIKVGVKFGWTTRVSQ